jgi:hypothetical protein
MIVPREPGARPLSLVCIAAPADIPFLIEWEKQLLPLQQAGLLTFWSEQHLSAGAVREEALFAHLNHTDAIILLLSADFFASKVCLTLMDEALQCQQKERTKVILLLLRPVEWQESPLSSLPCLPTTGVAVTRWSSQDEAFHVCLRELCSLLHLPKRSTRVPIPGKKPSDKNRERMLRRLRRSYNDLLAQSLQGIAWMDLGLTERPDAVQNVANSALRIEPHRAEQPLPPGVSIIQVYEDAEQELLILGEPGAGKSTELLALSQHLVAQAEQDEHALLPVILQLSSWAVKQGALADWMVEQIAVAYDIPRKVSQQWVEDEQILPLLDGLDEMEENARPVCIAAINAYHRAHLTSLVICSRTTEYESAADRGRLALQSAVVIRPLTSEQVEETLNRAGEAAASLQGALHRQPTLQDLATTPLMLSVLMLTYQGTTVCTTSLKEADLEHQVWTDYVERMVMRKQQGNVRRYSLSQTRIWLGWLAQQMRLHNQPLFYAERLEGNWLTEKLQRVYGWLAVQIPAILIGILTSLLVSVFLGNYSHLTSLFQTVLLGAFLGGWLSWRQTSLMPKRKCSLRVLVASLATSVILGVSFGFSLAESSSWLVEGWGALVSGIGMGLGGWVILWLWFRLSQATKPTSRHLFPFSWWNNIHLRRAMIGALVLGVVYGLIYGLNYWLRSGPRSGLFFGPSEGLIYGLDWGLTVFLLSFILEIGGGRFRLAERLHWNGWHLFRPKHLRDSLLIAGLLAFVLELSTGLSTVLNNLLIPDLDGYYVVTLSNWSSFGLFFGLVFGLSYWLLFGLYQGIVQEQIENEDRRTFNQGIRRSLRNGFLVSLLSGGVLMGIGILYFELNNVFENDVLYYDEFHYKGPSFGMSIVLHYNLSSAPFLAVGSFLLVWATIGGLTILRHYVIRLLLARSHTFPWHAQAFLDDATARILMRRVGGGYSFIHRRLLDYFAEIGITSLKVETERVAETNRGSSSLASSDPRQGGT